MGKGRATVTNTLRLLQLPAGAQRALAERTISAGHARALLGTPDRTLQDKLVEQITSEGLTVRAVEDIVRGGTPVRGVPAPVDGASPRNRPKNPVDHWYYRCVRPVVPRRESCQSQGF